MVLKNIVGMGGKLNRFPVKTPLLYYITDLYVSSDVSCGCVILAKNSMKFRLIVMSVYSMYQTSSTHNTLRWREREKERLGGMVHSVVCLLVGLVFTGRDVSSMLLAPFSHHSVAVGVSMMRSEER